MRKIQASPQRKINELQIKQTHTYISTVVGKLIPVGQIWSAMSPFLLACQTVLKSRNYY
jgi:hypothetical protein